MKKGGRLQKSQHRRKMWLTNQTTRAIITERLRRRRRGVEQLEARRAHNPEVVGSSPASATKKTT